MYAVALKAWRPLGSEKLLLSTLFFKSISRCDYNFTKSCSVFTSSADVLMPYCLFWNAIIFLLYSIAFWMFES